MEPPGLQLFAFPGKYGLPTLDPYSLIALTYGRFGGANLKVDAEYGLRSYWKLGGQLPTLAYGDRRVCGVRGILNELRELGIGTDYRLSTKQSADAMAFIALMEEKLAPAVLHTLWLTEKNYEEITRPVFAMTFKRLPMRFVLPALKYNSVRARVLQWSDDISCCTAEEAEEAIYQDAKECLAVVSAKLDSQDFLFGSSPTTADAYMFGLLVPLLQVPFPKNRLLPVVKAHPNICNCVGTILTRLFPECAKGADTRRTTGSGSDSDGRQQQASGSGAQPAGGSDATDSDYPHKRRNIVVAGVVALGLMVTYALATGIVQIEVEEKQSRTDDRFRMDDAD